MILRTVSLLTSVLAVSRSALASLQYCNVNPHDQTDFCLAVNTYRNASQGVSDFYLTLSAKFDRGRYGWVAVGAGTYVMHRSLIFVAYPGASDPSKLVVGARSTSYHDFPRHTSDLPDLTVVSTSFDDGYHVARFVCHACDGWDGAALRTDDDALPWIWANNPYSENDSDDADKTLSQHEFYGNWFADMTAATHPASAQQALSGAEEAVPAEPTFPAISASRVSISAGVRTHASTAPSSSSSSNTHTSASPSAFFIHGVLLAVAFGLLFPAGATALARGSARAHMHLQAVMAAAALAGVGLALSRALAAGGLQSLLHPHQALGVVVAAAVVAQGVLGWRNHVYFVRWGVGSPLKTHHAWMGRAVWAAGVANVLLGFGVAGEGARVQAGWAMVVVAQVLALGLVKGQRGGGAEGGRRGEKDGFVYQRVGLEDGEGRRSAEEA